MHNEIRAFFVRMRANNGMAFNAKRVLECGSYDINGNPRNFFRGAEEYVGLDWRPGPMVDVVSLVHEYREKPDGYFDFVIATSLIEHDPHWQDSLTRMIDLLADGGSILITCGGPGFHEHEKETAPSYTRGFEQHGPGEYYHNHEMRTIIEHLCSQARFRRIFLEDDPVTKDLRIFATDKMPSLAGVPAGWNGFKGVPQC